MPDLLIPDTLGVPLRLNAYRKKCSIEEALEQWLDRYASPLPDLNRIREWWNQWSAQLREFEQILTDIENNLSSLKAQNIFDEQSVHFTK